MIKLVDARLTDGLPDMLQQQPWVQALSEAVHEVTQRGIGYLESSRTYSRLNQLSGQPLDVLGVEMRAPHYRQDLPDSVKRTIIQNSMAYYARAGTKAAVQDLIHDLYCDAVVSEWFQYDGDPGHFRIDFDLTRPTVEKIADIDIGKISSTVSDVARASSHLDGISLSVTESCGLFVLSKLGVTLQLYPWHISQYQNSGTVQVAAAAKSAITVSVLERT